jgi:hypothetical protein
MHPLTQQLIVGVIVAAAAFVVARRYLPQALQNWLRVTVAGAARKLHLDALVHKLEAATAAATAAKSGSACGGGCAGCSAGTASGTNPATAPHCGNRNNNSSNGNTITLAALRKAIKH